MLRVSCLKDIPLSPTTSGVHSKSHNLHRTDRSSLDVREYAPGVFEWRPEINESACILEGRAEVDLADGRILRLRAGDSVFLPQGLHGRWIVRETLRTITVTNA